MATPEWNKTSSPTEYSIEIDDDIPF